MRFPKTSELKICRDFYERDPGLTLGDCLYEIGGGAEWALLYGSTFWPRLVEHDGLVFLADYFESENRTEIISGLNVSRSQLEVTINTAYIDDLFGVHAEDAAPGVVRAVGELLCETWVSCARTQFPDKQFIARFAYYIEPESEPGVVMCQREYMGPKPEPGVSYFEG